MPTSYVNADVARKMEREGRPWTVRVEYCGYNRENQSRHSDKWWEISGNGSGAVRCNFGATGSPGRREPLTYMMGEALEKLGEKRAKGYRYTPSTETSVPHPQSVSDLPEPYRSIKRIIALGGDLFRALDGFGNTVMDMDREGKDAMTAFNPWIAVG
jgi:predicted DNA-binding WGR domain protein